MKDWAFATIVCTALLVIGAIGYFGLAASMERAALCGKAIETCSAAVPFVCK